MSPPDNLVWSADPRGRDERETRIGQRGVVVWFTGLPGSGKSTLARALECALVDRGIVAYLLDGDNLRYGLNSDLDFSPAGRHENLRRIGEVARLFADAGAVALVAAVSPYHADRVRARALVGADRFVLVHVATDLAECEHRDVKGHYAKARAGTLPDFTGVSAPYEMPADADLRLETAGIPVDDGVATLLTYLTGRNLVPDRRPA